MTCILVIDDELEVRQSIVRVLARAGYEVSTAEDGPAGLNAFFAQLPDIVIVDVILPKMSGIQVIKEIRGRFPSARIVAMSGSFYRVPSAQLHLARSWRVQIPLRLLRLERTVRWRSLSISISSQHACVTC